MHKIATFSKVSISALLSRTHLAPIPSIPKITDTHWCALIGITVAIDTADARAVHHQITQLSSVAGITHTSESVCFINADSISTAAIAHTVINIDSAVLTSEAQIAGTGVGTVSIHTLSLSTTIHRSTVIKIDLTIHASRAGIAETSV